MFSSYFKDLTLKMENEKFSINELNLFVKTLSKELKLFQNKRTKLATISKNNDKYPILNDFSLSFDPLTESTELLETWFKYGFTVGKNVISDNNSNNAVNKINNILSEYGNVLDKKNTPILSRGFFELYHDDTLTQIRQSIRLYIYHSILWGTPFLWSSFDRYGVKPFQGESSIGLGLHVDQNPSVHPDFRTIQGVLALEDCKNENGTFIASINSIKYFSEYLNFIKPEYKGEFIPLEGELLNILSETQQLIPIKKNDIVSWDSRLTHANGSNISNINRYVCYISTGLAKEERKDLIDTRKDYFETGFGNNIRDAYMHASKKPRFTDQNFINSIRDTENFTLLGLCLYGFKSYKDLK
jgi:hypothetical protein